MKKLILVLIAAMVTMFGCKKSDITRELPSSTSKASVSSEPKLFEQPTNVAKYKANELLVKFKNNSNRSAIGKLRAEYVHTKAMERANYNGYYVTHVDNVEAELSRLKNSPEVEWVSPNWTEKILDLNPNDPYYASGEMYGLSHIKAEAAWNSGNVGKETVYVVIIDEGCMYWHCDLSGKIWENQEEVNGVAGVDDDHNGYVDDFRGWNWFNGNNNLYSGNDDHGTHVAGTIGAKGNNGIGVIGVAPNVKIISLKFLADYGFDNDAIKAIDYAIDLKVRKGLNIKVMSNSWGGGGFNQGLMDAIERAKNAGILFCAAAGNSNNNNDANPGPSYPSAYTNENIIAVGASDWTDSKAGFSSFGKTTVDLFAPGVNIWSTLPSATHTPSYGSYSGTSMATPHVSGGIALLASVQPELSWSQLKSTLLSTVTPVAQLSNYCVTGGVMNVSTFTGVTPPIVPNSVCGTPPAIDSKKPAPPMVLTLDSLKEDPITDYVTLYISWTKSFDENPITLLTFALTPFDTWNFEGNEWTGWAFQLPMDRLYTISGRAIDSWGNYSDPSNVIRVDYSGSAPPTDNIPPSVPTNLIATEITTSSFRASWNASTDNVGMRDYKIHWRSIGSVGWVMTFASATTYPVNTLLPNTDYEFFAIARDLAGNYSDTSAILNVRTVGDGPPPPPDTELPTLNGSPTTSNVTTASITFNHLAASDNVGVTGYTVNWRAAGGSWLQRSSTNLSETFSNLSANTTYEFYYTARDAAGNISLQSQTVSATTLTPEPPPPPSITVTLSGFVNGQQHNLSWVTNATIVTQVLQIKDKGTWSNIYTSNSPYSYIQTQNKKFFYRVIVNGVYISNEVGLQSKK